MAFLQTTREDEMNDPFNFVTQPSIFPPGTDQKIIQAFDAVDKDCSGHIDESELRSALSKCNQTYTSRTIRFFMCAFSKDTTFIGCVLQGTDRNRDGIVDANELRTALNNLGFPVSPKAVNLMIATYTNEKSRSGVSYDKFIECCAIVKGEVEPLGFGPATKKGVQPEGVSLVTGGFSPDAACAVGPGCFRYPAPPPTDELLDGLLANFACEVDALECRKLLPNGGGN
ncbi:hypothetical protein EJ110_NYTH51345 [Nymphaea thermarum]|nr:hypothetical protein EJ110_NYTH51345 [Nymphaea thermarum]